MSCVRVFYHTGYPSIVTHKRFVDGPMRGSLLVAQCLDHELRRLSEPPPALDAPRGGLGGGWRLMQGHRSPRHHETSAALHSGRRRTAAATAARSMIEPCVSCRRARVTVEDVVQQRRAADSTSSSRHPSLKVQACPDLPALTQTQNVNGLGLVSTYVPRQVFTKPDDIEVESALVHQRCTFDEIDDAYREICDGRSSLRSVPLGGVTESLLHRIEQSSHLMEPQSSLMTQAQSLHARLPMIFPTSIYLPRQGSLH